MSKPTKSDVLRLQNAVDQALGRGATAQVHRGEDCDHCKAIADMLDAVYAALGKRGRDWDRPALATVSYLTPRARADRCTATFTCGAPARDPRHHSCRAGKTGCDCNTLDCHPYRSQEIEDEERAEHAEGERPNEPV